MRTRRACIHHLSVRNFLLRLFYIIPHCRAVVRQPEYGLSIVRTRFLITSTLCIPESWNGEGLCRTHESQRPIAVNCVRTRILCHRKFRFCTGDWFYKKAKEKARAYNTYLYLYNCNENVIIKTNRILFLFQNYYLKLLRQGILIIVLLRNKY